MALGLPMQSNVGAFFWVSQLRSTAICLHFGMSFTLWVRPESPTWGRTHVLVWTLFILRTSFCAKSVFDIDSLRFSTLDCSRVLCSSSDYDLVIRFQGTSTCLRAARGRLASGVST